MSVKPIHHFSMENPASVYDEEALTALELAARTAGKVNECVQAFNNHEKHTKEVVEKFKSDTNADIDQFKSDTNADIDRFKSDTNEDIDGFKQSVNQSLSDQDEEIDQATAYMKDNIRQTTADELAGMKENGELDHIIEGSVFTDFSHRTENMVTPEMFGAKGDGVTDDSTALQQAVNTGKPVYLGAKVYVLKNTITLPSGAEIVGSKNSIIHAYAPVVFYLTNKNTLNGFFIRVKSANTLSVFETNDNTVGSGSLLFTNITNVDVYNDLTETPEMFTVCHFQATEKGYYGITVKDCTFVCNATGGYAVRVYTNGNGWLSTCSFINNYSRNFAWHYFFAENDKNIINNSSGTHIVTNCLAQCSGLTHGFTFMKDSYSAKVTNCVTWDWGSPTAGSITCKSTPYVFGPDYPWLNDGYKNDIGGSQIIIYDGTNFIKTNYNATLMLKTGGHYPANLIPKYVGIPAVRCVKLLTLPDNPSAPYRVRFFLCDRRGVNEVSIYPSEQIVATSKPISGIKFGYDVNTRTLYMYASDKIRTDLGIMTLPVTNSMIRFGAGNTNNSELTPDIWKDTDSYWMDEVPEGLTEMVTKINPHLFLQDSETGTIYRLKLKQGDDGTMGIAIEQAYNTLDQTQY